VVTFKWIPIASIIGSVYQPRLQEDRGLSGLTESIRVNGLLVPLTVLNVRNRSAWTHPTIPSQAGATSLCGPAQASRDQPAPGSTAGGSEPGGGFQFMGNRSSRRELGCELTRTATSRMYS
jgi:hypothetical protein